MNALNLSSLWDALQSQSMTELLNALVALDLTDVKATLANTSMVIGYATSSDGYTWTVSEANDFTGADVYPSGTAGP